MKDADIPNTVQTQTEDVKGVFQSNSQTENTLVSVLLQHAVYSSWVGAVCAGSEIGLW